LTNNVGWKEDAHTKGRMQMRVAVGGVRGGEQASRSAGKNVPKPRKGEGPWSNRGHHRRMEYTVKRDKQKRGKRE